MSARLLILGLAFAFAAPPFLLAAEESDACSLILASEIEAVQGEALSQAKPSGRASGGVLFQTCFYALPTYTKSVSLQLTKPDPAAETPTSPRKQWEKVFHREHGEADEKDKGEEEEKESEPPQAIEGLGDEAFWVSDRVVGVLYVLKGDVFFRISLGGDAPKEERIEKSKQLALKVLGRL